MSTILKALRRLEDDRTSHGDRTLREQVAAARTPAEQRRWPFFLIFALVVAGVAAGGAFWLGGGTDAADAPELAQAAPGEAPAKRDRPGASAVKRGPPINLQERRASARPSRPARQVARTPARPARTPSASAAPELPAAALASPVEVVKRPPPPPRLPDPDVEPVEEVVAARAPEPRAERPVVVAAAPSPPRPAAAPPVKAEPSPEQVRAVKPSRPALPDVRVERTVWHPVAERRVAVVAFEGDGPREIHEGDAVGSLVVGEIEPSGVVFVHEGTEVRRGVGQ